MLHLAAGELKRRHDMKSAGEREAAGREEKETRSDFRANSAGRDVSQGAADWAFRRRLVGVVAALMLIVAGLGQFTGMIEEWSGSASTSRFTVAALTRIGLVLGAIWLAWDSLRKPARWLPPGLALVGVIGIVMVAAQPKLVIAILPLFGFLTIFTSVLRAFRGDG
ncbi:putative membrane protein [Rhodopirellula sallentina SM41]|uniref:Putative membrane protein n=2 Tax=Rhodopirellula TaxID=265488 RepID=M5TXS1_9BACT|nr:putative membrane protein [Rhodopirellula sallentina SM41]